MLFDWPFNFIYLIYQLKSNNDSKSHIGNYQANNTWINKLKLAKWFGVQLIILDEISLY